MSETLIEGYRSVHVHYGREQHLAGKPGSYKTLCGKWWVATNIGPPATDRPVCDRCLATIHPERTGDLNE